MGCKGSKGSPSPSAPLRTAVAARVWDAAALAAYLAVDVGTPFLRGCLEKLPVVGVVLNGLEQALTAWDAISGVKEELELLRDCVRLLLRNCLPHLKVEDDYATLQKWLEKAEEVLRGARRPAQGLIVCSDSEAFVQDLRLLRQRLVDIRICLMQVTCPRAVQLQSLTLASLEDTTLAALAVPAAGDAPSGSGEPSMQCTDEQVEQEAYTWLSYALRDVVRVTHGREYSQQDCILEALRRNPNLARGWNFLGVLGGGLVPTAEGERNYDSKACYIQALQCDAGLATAWVNLGIEGGGSVKLRPDQEEEQPFSREGCYIQALKSDPCCAVAWVNFGNNGGGRVYDGGEDYSRRICFLHALECDPDLAPAWLGLGVSNGGIVKSAADGEREFKMKDCYIRALQLAPRYAAAYAYLGMVGGGKVWDSADEMDQKACYVKALECDPGYAMAWKCLAGIGGGTVAGIRYDANKCKEQYEALVAKFRVTAQFCTPPSA